MQLNSFNDLRILAIYISYSCGFKNVQYVIEMALKLLLFASTSQKLPNGWGLCPQAPVCDTLEFHQFVQLMELN